MIKIKTLATEAKPAVVDMTALTQAVTQTQQMLAELAQAQANSQRQNRTLVAEIERDPVTDKMTRVIITVQQGKI